VWTIKMAKKSIKKPIKPKTLLELENYDCRWPIGDPKQPNFHFCGGPNLPGRPYCEHHWRMAFLPAKPRQHPPLAVPSAIPKAA
jgi:GcrA cell cycle regulator